MLVSIPSVLDAGQLAHARHLLDEAEWIDGRNTAGVQSSIAKRNQQLPQEHPAAREIGDLIIAGLAGNALFLSAALPKAIFPPLFNRYSATSGHGFGNHVDNAIRYLPDGRGRLRTDLSATLFLSEPSEYEGGELIIEDSYGAHAIKLAAGEMILYPSSSLHRVEPLTHGTRLASFFWIESMVRDPAQRNLLLDMDVAVRGLAERLGDDAPEIVSLTGCYHNLLRRWAES
jgi:predicted 2-oxoglutarate/Fe(II)-dependent dioxygenase YbiX